MSAVLRAKVLSTLLQKALPATAAVNTSSFKPESLALTLGTVPVGSHISANNLNSNAKNNLVLSNFAARSSLQFANLSPSFVTKQINCANDCDPTKLGEGDYCGYCG